MILFAGSSLSRRHVNHTDMEPECYLSSISIIFIVSLISLSNKTNVHCYIYIKKKMTRIRRNQAKTYNVAEYMVTAYKLNNIIALH